MSELYFSCIYCGKSLCVDERGVGSVIKCVDCGYEQGVPEGEGVFRCVGCGVEHLAAKSAFGREVRCVGCGSKITVPEFGGGVVRGGRWVVMKKVVGVMYYGGLIGLVIFLVYVMVREEDGVKDVRVVREEAVGQSSFVGEVYVKRGDVVISNVVVARDVKKEITNVIEVQSNVVKQELVSSNVVVELSDEQIRNEELKLAEKLGCILCSAVTSMVPHGCSFKYDEKVSGKVRRLRELFYLYLGMFNEVGYNYVNGRLHRLMEYSFAVEFVDGGSAYKALKELEGILYGMDLDAKVQDGYILRLMSEFVFRWARRDIEVSIKVLEDLCLKEREYYKVYGVRCIEDWKIASLWDDVIYGVFELVEDKGRRDKYLGVARKRFMEYLSSDKRLDINQKISMFTSVMRAYKTYGEVEGLCEMLDKMVERYGDKIRDSNFYWMRMMLALDAEGDWVRAEDSLARVRKLVRAGVISSNDVGYNAMMRVYYSDLKWPGYEIARRYRERMRNNEIERREIMYEYKKSKKN